FLLALVFFVLILELVDLFTNLWNYLNNDVPYSSILLVQLYYLPKCISYSLPIGLLFAASFTLGTMYAHNELIAIFGSGISLAWVVAPIVLFGLLASFFSYRFQDAVVIPTYQEKRQLTEDMLQRKVTFSNANVTVLGAGGRIIYHADFYNDTTHSLSGLTILKRDRAGRFIERIDAQTATWRDGTWQLNRVRLIDWNSDNTFLRQTDKPVYTEPDLNEPPDTFKRTVRNVDEMSASEAHRWIDSLRKAGLPYRGELTDYYNRFTFAATPFIVTFISSAIGGRFKKNILLMSLFSSLVLSVIYYVTQMMSVLLAKLGYISPLTGASAGVLLFLLAGVWLFRSART
ncbi:MAG TPA: LptF/LptG family permease, partial [Spirochaetia bacterium]|nr:LptF/LptG family permease [Spirochaetia bacterium]